MMKIIECINGEAESVRSAAKSYLKLDPILAEVGEICSTITFLPVHVSLEIWIQCFHSGYKAKYLMVLTNKVDSNASAVCLEGSEWNALCIMRAATKIVSNVYFEFSFREKRSILIDIGKASYKALSKLNKGIYWGTNEEELFFNNTIDPYQPLNDIEWIEERMEEAQ